MALSPALGFKVHATVNPLVAGFFRREAADALDDPMLKLERVSLEQLLGLLGR